MNKRIMDPIEISYFWNSVGHVYVNYTNWKQKWEWEKNCIGTSRNKLDELETANKGKPHEIN